MGDVALEHRVLAGEVHQLSVLGGGQHGLAPGADRLEGRGEIDLLKGARPEHLVVDLAGQRQNRRAVDLRVPHPGQQVGGAGAGDRQAGGRPPGQLAVGGGGERRRALVADADVGELAVGLPPPDRVGEPEVRVADHAEHVPDPPVDHRPGHHVGDGLDVRGRRLDADEDLAVAHLERIGGRLVLEAGGLPGQRAVVEAVPGTAQQPVLDRALAEGPALMRAVVVEGAELALVVNEGDALEARVNGGHAALGQLILGQHPVPLQLLGPVGGLGHRSTPRARSVQCLLGLGGPRERYTSARPPSGQRRCRLRKLVSARCQASPSAAPSSRVARAPISCRVCSM